MKTRQDKDITDHTGAIYTENDSRDLFDCVGFVMKTKEDNDVTDCIGVVYAETETKLLEPIEPGAVCYLNKIEKWLDWPYKCSLHQKRNWAIVTDWIKCGLWWKQVMTTTWPIV